MRRPYACDRDRCSLFLVTDRHWTSLLGLYIPELLIPTCGTLLAVTDDAACAALMFQCLVLFAAFVAPVCVWPLCAAFILSKRFLTLFVFI